MPALTIGASLNPHVFGTGNHNKKKLSGFHSKAKYNSCPLKPQIKTTFNLGNKGFYLCGWNYFDNDENPKKWSTMFPDSWDDKKVIKAITSAVEYWNNTKDADERARLEALTRTYDIHWVGNVKVDGYTFTLGGMTNSSTVVTGFPLMGANGNIPRPNFTVHTGDVETGEE
jgi:hypothetical protein